MAKALPHSIASEESVLGAVMLRNELIDDLSLLVGPADFYVPKHKAVWEAMLDLAADERPIDPVTLEHVLRANEKLGLVGGLEGLGQLCDRYGAVNGSPYHAEQIRGLAVQRSTIQVAREIADEGMDVQPNVGEWVESAESRFLAATEVRSVGGPKAVSYLVSDAWDGIRKTAQLAKETGSPVTGVPTGFGELDLATAGLQPGDLVLLGARPSMGKTSLAMNIADAAAVSAKIPVLVFSLEMTELQLTQRLIYARAAVDSQLVRQGKLLPEDMTSLCNAATVIHQAPIYIDDKTTTLPAMRAIARRWRRSRKIFPLQEDGKRPLGLILVDYIQLASSGEKTENRNLEVGAISKGLKGIAKELELPVLALSQLNRDVDSRSDHRPQLADLRDSGTLEQDADVVMFLYREARYLGLDIDDAIKRAAELIIAKQRNGPTPTLPLIWRGERTRFYGMERTQDSYGR